MDMEPVNINWTAGSVSTDLTTSLLDHELQFQEFELSYFLDFCSALDTCVLQEYIYNIDFSTNSKRYLDNPFTNELFGNGRIIIADLPHDANYIFDHPVSTSLLSTIPNQFNFDELQTWNDYHSNLSRACPYAILEYETEIPFIPNFHTTPAYVWNGKFKGDQLFANEIYMKLHAEYESLKTELFKLRKLLDGENFLQLPPISFQILQRASKYEEIPEVMMEIRKLYAPLRSKFVELQELLLSKDISLKKKLKEKQKLFRAIDLFSKNLKKESTFIMSSVAGTLNEFGDVGKLVEAPSVVTGVRWTKVMDLIIKSAEKTYLKFKLRPLYSTKSAYLGASTNDIISIVEKHYGRRLTEADFDTVNKYSEFTKGGMSELY